MAGARNQGATRLERNWAAVERFAAACQGDAAVLAAFLGGSLAAGTADEESDLDVYIVVAEPGYDAFVDRPKDFLASWGEVAFATTLRNFEGLGFEMVLFVMTDGVEGELAVGKEANFRSTHGGPHRVLVDKTGILEGVEFPALALDDRASADDVDRTLWWFWWQVRAAVKAWARGKWWESASQLKGVRDSCLLLARAAGVSAAHQALAATFAPLDEPALADAIRTAVRCYNEWGRVAADAVGVAYPEALAAVGAERVEGSLRAPA